jgi:hypothetical protein
VRLGRFLRPFAQAKTCIQAAHKPVNEGSFQCVGAPSAGDKFTPDIVQHFQGVNSRFISSNISRVRFAAIGYVFPSFEFLVHFSEFGGEFCIRRIILAEVAQVRTEHSMERGGCIGVSLGAA